MCCQVGAFCLLIILNEGITLDTTSPSMRKTYKKRYLATHDKSDRNNVEQTSQRVFEPRFNIPPSMCTTASTHAKYVYYGKYSRVRCDILESK